MRSLPLRIPSRAARSAIKDASGPCLLFQAKSLLVSAIRNDAPRRDDARITRRGTQQPSIGGWEVATCSPAASPPKPPHVFRRSVLRTEFNADGGGGFLSYRHPAHAAPRGVHMSLGEARAAPGT